MLDTNIKIRLIKCSFGTRLWSPTANEKGCRDSPGSLQGSLWSFFRMELILKAADTAAASGILSLDSGGFWYPWYFANLEITVAISLRSAVSASCCFFNATVWDLTRAATWPLIFLFQAFLTTLTWTLLLFPFLLELFLAGGHSSSSSLSTSESLANSWGF